MWVGKGVTGSPTQLAELEEGKVYPGTQGNHTECGSIFLARGGCGPCVEMGMSCAGENTHAYHLPGREMMLNIKREVPKDV